MSKEWIQPNLQVVIPKQSGRGFRLKAGQHLRVTDIYGSQVSDLYCFVSDDLDDALSSGRSIDYGETILFCEGNQLYSGSGKPVLEIVEDSCGRHDFLVTPCSQQMFTMMSGKSDYHPSCLENLQKGFAEIGLHPKSIGTTFNIFMNVTFDPNGRIKVETPTSRAGDTTTFRALVDLHVALTACSDEGSNGGSCKPVMFEILDP